MIIDLQAAIDFPSWGTRNNEQAEERVAQLLNAWRQAGRPLMHVKHMSVHPDSPYWPEGPGNAFKPQAMPLPGEEVLEKTTNSAFIGTGLDESLRARGISELVVAGVITNNSVEATVRMAGNLGYRTVLVEDATFTFGRRDFSGKWHEAQVIHDIALANMDGEYAEVRSTADVLALLETA